MVDCRRHHTHSRISAQTQEQAVQRHGLFLLMDRQNHLGVEFLLFPIAPNKKKKNKHIQTFLSKDNVTFQLITTSKIFFILRVLCRRLIEHKRCNGVNKRIHQNFAPNHDDAQQRCACGVY